MDGYKLKNMEYYFDDDELELDEDSMLMVGDIIIPITVNYRYEARNGEIKYFEIAVETINYWRSSHSLRVSNVDCGRFEMVGSDGCWFYMNEWVKI